MEGPPKTSAMIETASEQREAYALTPRAREATILLTKVAHLLRPQIVPDIEDVENENRSVRDGVMYETPAYDGDNETVPESDTKTLRAIERAALELDELGLTWRLQAFSGYYSVKADKSVQYIKPFVPWELDATRLSEEDLTFNFDTLKQAVRRNKSLSPEDKELCERNLERIEELFKEEQVERETNLPDAEPAILELEPVFQEAEQYMDVLRAITTKEEALQSEVRKSTKETYGEILKRLNELWKRTNVSIERYRELHARLKVISNAIGHINGSVVEHNR